LRNFLLTSALDSFENHLTEKITLIYFSLSLILIFNVICIFFDENYDY